MQVTSATSATSATGGISSMDSLATSSQTLNQKDFLKLLVSQMVNQDPMNPQSDTQMAAQMAQFTSLTQASAMSSSLAMLQADSLLGSTVTLQLDSKTSTSGVVQGVILQNGTPQIMVNGASYDLSQVVAVTPTATAATTAPTSAPTNN
ncbi:MAG TPA: flagellar hook capping FlgD N-terminal domain-containing protein [Verrucomicrobiae bacterium]